MVEYIAKLDLNTDGDWGYSPELRQSLEVFEYDGGFDAPVVFCDTFEDALESIKTPLEYASFNNGIFRGDMSQSDVEFLTKLSSVRDLFVELSGNVNTTSIESDIEKGSNIPGGVSIYSEWGNWSVDATVYIRHNGRIGQVEELWV